MVDITQIYDALDKECAGDYARRNEINRVKGLDLLERCRVSELPDSSKRVLEESAGKIGDTLDGFYRAINAKKMALAAERMGTPAANDETQAKPASPSNNMGKSNS